MKKTFEIDWNSYDEVSALGNQIKSRLGKLNNEFVSKRERNRMILDACYQIKDTNISSIYNDRNLSTESKFYVYVHLDTSRRIAIGANGISSFAATLGMNFLPFYVGKGTGDRCLDLNRNGTHRKVCQKLTKIGKAPEVMKVGEDLSEAEALALESKLIDIFGLIHVGGLLTNLDEGSKVIERRALYSEAINLLTYKGKLPKMYFNGSTA